MSNSAALCTAQPTAPILKSRGRLRVGFSKADLITVIWKRKKQIDHQSIENSQTENQSLRINAKTMFMLYFLVNLSSAWTASQY